MTAALDGLSVLEVTLGDAAAGGAGSLAASYGAALLAGLGAAVTKIEPPRGDALRRAGPFPQDAPHRDHGGLFWSLNAAKRAAAIDLESAAGRRILQRLTDRAAIVIHDAPAQTAEAYGLAYTSLEASNPALIVVAVTPFGQDGPYRDWRAAELQQQALSGLLDLTGEPDREPLQIGPPLAQYAAGQIVAAAALTARFAQRDDGAGGQLVDVSVLESACSIMEHSPAIYQYRGIVRRRTGNWGGLSGWGIYPCRDGYVGVVSGLGETYQRFRRLIGGTLLEERFASPAARSQHAADMHAAIVQWLEHRTKAEAFHAAQAQRIPFSALATTADVAASAQLQARGYLDPVAMPGCEAAIMPGPPMLIEGCEWRRGPAPRLGQQTTSLLRDDLALSPAAVVRLRRAGVVR